MNFSSDRNARVIVVASGKGGVGKTAISVNLAVALARLGRRTMLVDHDLGTANANILLGIDAETGVADILTRDCGADEVLRMGPGGIAFLPGHSGTAYGTSLSAADRRHMAGSLRPFAGKYDDIVVDTGSGIAAGTLTTVAASDLVLLVLGDEPTAFMDAYAMAKSLSLRHGCTDLAVVCNMVADDASGRALFDRFRDVAGRFLPVRLSLLGSIPDDHHVRASVYAKKCCVEAYPHSRASAAFARLARSLSGRALAPMPGGDRFFGMEVACGAH
ncbi:MAG: AAA family ATPase [Allosphingosinicella sp.]|uniref:nucleotide-binding protein n=1 Tax=Allosphingosinicella sp. TaxID=2823234 RepID=UPI003958F001